MASEKSKKLKEFFEKQAKKENDYFFGENNLHHITNQYFTYKSILDEDTFIINTANLYYFKKQDTVGLIVGTNKVVYLKPSQVKMVIMNNGSWSCLVKLTRKYFKVYTYKNRICDDIEIEKEQDFNTLKSYAKAQQDRMNLLPEEGQLTFKKDKKRIISGLYSGLLSQVSNYI